MNDLNLFLAHSDPPFHSILVVEGGDNRRRYIQGAPTAAHIATHSRTANNRLPVNPAFTAIVNQYRVRFNEARNRREKRAIVREIGQDIRQRGLSFVRFHRPSNQWYDVSFTSRRVKRQIRRALCTHV